jgi:hypothetical protein
VTSRSTGGDPQSTEPPGSTESPTRDSSVYLLVAAVVLAFALILPVLAVPFGIALTVAAVIGAVRSSGGARTRYLVAAALGVVVALPMVGAFVVEWAGA